MDDQDTTILRVKIPEATKPKKEYSPKKTYSLSRSCGTLTFVLLQSLIIVSMVKISMNSPLNAIELMVSLGIIFTIYCVCVTCIIFTPTLD
jgi:hypothetical protein